MQTHTIFEEMAKEHSRGIRLQFSEKEKLADCFVSFANEIRAGHINFASIKFESEITGSDWLFKVLTLRYCEMTD